MKAKTYILGLIAVAALAGMFWYGDWSRSKADNSQTASIIDQNGEQDENTGQSNEDNSANGIKVAASEANGDIILGSPEAPVTMVEYSSYLCGHCVNFHLNNLPTLIEKYVQTGKLKIIPRLVSPVELSAAVLCANEQDSFYEFNEYLFSHIQDLDSVDDVKSIVGKLGLDQEMFDACYGDNRYDDQIKDWFNKADADGVAGTPTFFINGEKIVGNQPLDVFESVIEKYSIQ